MRILVTGATGLIGRQLVADLALGDPSTELLLLGRSLDRLVETFGDTDHRLIQTEYGEGLFDGVDRGIDGVDRGVDGIVHLAASVHDPSRTFDDYRRLNVEPTRRLFTSAARLGIRNIVFTSSRTVYENSVNEVPFDERQHCDPNLPYARAKLACEALAEEHNRDHDLRIKCLRLGQVFGADPSHGGTIERMIGRARRGEALEVFGEGRAARDYVYVKDVTAAIRAALAQPGIAGVFNVGSGVPTSYLALAEAVRDALCPRLEIRQAADDRDTGSVQFLAIAKAAAELDWNPHWSLAEALIDLRDLADPMRDSK